MATIQLKINNPLKNEGEVFYLEGGKTVSEIVYEYFPIHVLDNLDLFADGEHVQHDSDKIVSDNISVNYNLSGAAVPYIWQFVIAIVVGYVSYKMALKKMGTFSEPQESQAVDTLRSQRNTDKRNQPLPFVLGERRVVPALAALPYTEIEGKDQYLNMLLSVCHAPVKIEDIRIGETPITDFPGVQYQVYDGYYNKNMPTLFPNDIVEEPVDFQFKDLVDADGNPTQLIRTTSPDIDVIGVDILFPQGLVRWSDDGTPAASRVNYRIEYKPTTSSNWILYEDVVIVPDGSTRTVCYDDFGRTTDGSFGRCVTETTSTGIVDAFYKTHKIPVSLGQYDVRVTYTDRSHSDTKTQNLFIWQSMKSIRNSSPVTTTMSALIAVRIKASDHLSGNLDRVNCKVTSLVPKDWNADWSDWRGFEASYRLYYGRWPSRQLIETITGRSLIPSKNPSDLYRWVTQGPMVKQAITNDKLDLENLAEFKQYCIDNNFECNAVIDGETTLGQLLNQIASTANSEFAINKGKYGVFTDKPREFYNAVLNFTNASNISFTRDFLHPIDGFVVEFDNKETNYEKDSVVAYTKDGDEDPATGDYERLQLFGVTNHDQAFRLGRHFLAERNLRQEAWKLKASIQAIDVTRGDLVLVQMPTIGTGIASGRIKSIAGNAITTDELCIPITGQSHSIMIANQLNGIIVKEVVAFDGYEITLNNTTGINVRDRFSFGVTGNETRECIVNEVKPNSDMTIDLTMVNYAPEIYSIDGQSVPPYSPIVNLPNPEDLLPLPIFNYLTAHRSRVQTEDGSFKVNVVLGYRYNSTYGVSDFNITLEYKKTSETFYRTVGTQQSSSGEFVVEGLNDRTSYDFRLRASKGNSISDWAVTSYYIETSTIEDPEMPQITGLRLYENESGNEFTGKDIKLIWNNSSTTRSYDLGDEPAGADDGALDPYFKDYLIEIVDYDTRDIIRSEYSAVNNYTYSYEKNTQDGGPRRKVLVQVYARGINNQLSSIPAKIVVENPAPELHTGFNTSVRFSGAVFTWNPNTDLDFEGTRIYISNTTGFTPSTATLKYDGGDNHVVIDGLSSETQYFMRYEVYDAFRDLPTLSGEMAFTTLRVKDELGLSDWATQIDPVDRDFINTHLTGDAIPSTKIENLTAAKITTGVIQATELLEVEGQIKSVQEAGVPGFEVTLGPQTVSGDVYLINANDGSGNVIFGVDQFGNATFTGGGTFSGNVIIKDGVSDVLKLDSINKSIWINNATFGNSGIQLQYNAGSPRVYIGDGSTQYLQYNSNGLTLSGDITLDTNNYWKKSNNTFRVGGSGSSLFWDGSSLITNTLKTASGASTRIEISPSGDNRIHVYEESNGVTLETCVLGRSVEVGGDLYTARFGNLNRAYIGVAGFSFNVGVYGKCTLTGTGVQGETEDGVGVYGRSNTNSGIFGLSASGFGVVGQSSTGVGIIAQSASTTKGAFRIAPKSNNTLPTAPSKGDFVVLDNGQLYYYTGIAWVLLT